MEVAKVSESNQSWWAEQSSAPVPSMSSGDIGRPDIDGEDGNQSDNQRERAADDANEIISECVGDVDSSSCAATDAMVPHGEGLQYRDTCSHYALGGDGVAGSSPKSHGVPSLVYEGAVAAALALDGMSRAQLQDAISAGLITGQQFTNA